MTLEALARFAGTHAVALYMAVLAALWGVTVAGHALAARRRPSSAPPQRRAWPSLAWRLALGFGVVVAGAAAFAELAEQLDPGHDASWRMGVADQLLADTLQQELTAPTLTLVALVTKGADTQTLTVLTAVIAGLLVWHRRWALALAWVGAVGGNGLLNITLKQIFARVRPLHDDGPVMAQGFSFPSGHSSGAVVAYGMLAYLAVGLLPPRWHLPLLLAAVTAAFTIGVSRVMLRVHFASDVVAGFTSGAVWLAVCITCVETARWARR